MPGQQKVREHGSGALRKWQTKLRKWCKLGKGKKKRKVREKETNGKWEKRRKKKEEEGKKRKRQRGQNYYRVTIKIVNTKYGIVN